MAYVISICNQKGGVGKTTTCLNLGAYLAILGRRVLIIDFDSQANATVGLGLDYQKINKNVYHLILNLADFREVIYRARIFSLDLIPSSPDLIGAQVELNNLPMKETILFQKVNQIRNHYHYILIDLPPSLGLLTINGLVASDKVIIPIQAEFFALEGLKQLISTINLIKRNLGKNIEILGALLTLYDKRNRLNRLVLKNIRRSFPGYVFETVIPKNIALAESPSFGKTILEYSPSSKGAKAYLNLAKEVINLLEKNISSNNLNNLAKN